MKQLKNVKEVTPSEKGDIIQLSKSEYTLEAIARKTGFSLKIIEAYLYEQRNELK